MKKDIKLIELYCTVCYYYDNVLAAQAQRMSNNDHPVFTDAECLTIYLFGLSQSLFTVKAIYDFIKDFFPGWFPNLPSYQAVNHRLCLLSETLRELCCLLISRRELAVGSTFLIDSLPITVANAKRSGKAKTASGLCAKSYCASQNKWYYGVKLHIFGQKVYGTLPRITMSQVTPADEHDLQAAKEMLSFVQNIILIADKAYCDRGWNSEVRYPRQSRGLVL